jgi:cell division protein FtsW (lipid II flippase)
MATPAAPEWRAHAGIGIILLLDTLILKLAPTGPWESESFSLGVIGLTGLTLLYVAWYRLTFQRKGLVPWMDLWKDPERSSRSVIAAGLAIIAAAWLAGNVVEETVPKPAGLILTLVGLLVLLNGIYVYLSVGALSDTE